MPRGHIQTSPRRGPSVARAVVAAAIEAGLNMAARRAVTSIRRAAATAEARTDDRPRAVTREPLKTLGVAIGVGLVSGLVAGWLGGPGPLLTRD